MNLVVFADFTCPECYLASRRADVLCAAGVAVEWCAVEHRPRMPIGGEPLGPAEQDALARRFADLEELLLPGETLPWAPPRLLAKSEAAVTAYAEAVGAGVGSDVRRLLFELYWRGGADIGSPTVLRAPLAGPVRRGNSEVQALRYSGFAVSVDRGPITTSAHSRIREWREQWRGLGCPAAPIVLTEGATLVGIDALRRLGKEIRYADADPAWTAPRGVPAAAPVRPGPRWTSWVGDPWRTTNRFAQAR